MSTTDTGNRSKVRPGEACPACGHGDPLRVPDGEEEGMEIRIGDALFYDEGACPECGQWLVLDT